MRMRTRHRRVKYAECDSSDETLRETSVGRLSDRAKRAARRARRATAIQRLTMTPLEEEEEVLSQGAVTDVELVETVAVASEKGDNGKSRRLEDGGKNVGTEDKYKCEGGLEKDAAVDTSRCADVTVPRWGNHCGKDTKETIGLANAKEEEREVVLVNLASDDEHSSGRQSRVFDMPGCRAWDYALQQQQTIFLWDECLNRVEPKQVAVSQVLRRLAARSHLSLYVGQDDPMFLHKMEGKMIASEDVERWTLDMTKPGLQRRVMIFYAYQLVLMPFLESPQVCSLEMYMERAEQKQARQFTVFAGALTCTEGLACDCGTYVKQILE